MTVQPDITPTTSGVSEDIPEHIRQGEALANAVEDVAEQFEAGLVTAIRRHIQSAEGIPGFPASIQGQWEDEVASVVEQAFALLRQAAEGARSAAEAEERALAPLVEAAQAAPGDAGGLTVGVLQGA